MVLLVTGAISVALALSLPLPVAMLPALLGLAVASIFLFDLGPTSVIRVRRAKDQDLKPRRRTRRRLSAEP